ncbi:MAG: FAD-binding oxidoreductase [Oscillospiraceae bacterium]|jgi:FAD/FMN-containing dehydrogenase|nr:FAD-binding oxidoreductase [Oscillospiraceae bacterium]
MEKSALIAGLEALLGKDRVLTDEQVILDCSKDYIGFRVYERFDGRFDVPRAACVVKPKNTNEVSAALRFLNEYKVDTVPRTGGSSVTLGLEPQEGGVILDGSDMNEIIGLNEYDMMVTVRCGTPLAYLENYLNERGYTTGHQPQSLPMAQVGGLVATRSIGQFSTLYGGIEDLLMGLEAVLPCGEVVRIKNNPRRSVGPDLRHLFIGSEGMLGFITEATLKIFKYKPEDRWMNAYAIRHMKDGLALFREIMVEGYRPAVMRLHDEVEVETLFEGVAPDEYNLLLFVAEGPKPVADATGAFIDEAIRKYDYVDLGKKPVESWLVTRNDTCDDMDRPKYYKMRAVADTCEISAPWSVIGEIHSAVRERMPEELDNLVTVGGHSSHSYVQGTNIYFTFGYFLGMKGGEYARPDYMHVVKIIMEETLKRGGSIAHHHGSGKYRTQWMPEEHGSSYTLLYKLKEALDPNGIMNKGVLLVERE